MADRLRLPFWLNNRELNEIDQALGSHHAVRTLNPSQQQKVAALLYSISYADKWAVRRGTWLSRLMLKGASLLGRLMPPKKGLADRKVSPITKEATGVPAMIDHLVHQIGLDKTPPTIFTEYHTLTPPTPHKPPIDTSAYVSDGLEAYRYVLNE